MKSTLIAIISIASSIFFHSSARADTTVQFYEPYTSGSGIPNNLANGSGTVTDGMRWGIVVSTTNGSFAGAGPLAANSYDAYLAGSSAAGFLSVGGVLTDDYFIPGTLTTDASGLYGSGDNGTTPGSGSIIEDIGVTYTNGVSTNDVFSLIWFGSAANASTAGSKYGFFSDPSFVLPSDTGATVAFGTPFAGNDATRTASNTFQTIAAVPEPSRVLFLALGCMGFLMRRRRA